MTANFIYIYILEELRLNISGDDGDGGIEHLDRLNITILVLKVTIKEIEDKLRVRRSTTKQSDLTIYDLNVRLNTLEVSYGQYVENVTGHFEKYTDNLFIF